jgi:phosphoenolpyruvate---glycerone phosphotransferase subunit DhaL
MPGLTTSALRDGLTRIINKLEVSADELNSLDAVLGDGDLGVTLMRGGRSILVELPNLPDDDLGVAFSKCAQALTRISGSTCGTLFATGLLSAAKTSRGRSELPWIEVSGILAKAIEAMSQRGKSQLGDKTVLDAVEAARLATDGLEEPRAMIVAADQAVAGSIERFRMQASRQGRARIFADRSVGNPDPGMVAFKRILEALK